jgi:hypothetical protein
MAKKERLGKGFPRTGARNSPALRLAARMPTTPFVKLTKAGGIQGVAQDRGISELGSRLYNTLNQKPSGGLEPFELGKTYAGARDPSGAAARYAEWRCSRRYGGARLPAARVPSD